MPIKECAACGKEVYRQACKANRKKDYCDQDCRVAEKYTWFGFLFSRQRSHYAQQSADHIGIPKSTLRTWVFQINQGLPEHMKIRFRKPNQIRAQGARDKKEKQLAIPKPKKPKEKKHTQSMQKAPKPEPKKYAKREIDMSQYHYVRLDSKTIVLRKKTA